MAITLTIKEIIMIVIGISVVILIAYLIKLLKALIETSQRTNKVLEDVEVVSAIAAEKAQKLDEVADDAIESIGLVADMLKGNQSSVKAAANLVNSLASIKSLFKDSDSKKEKGKNNKN